MFSNENATDRSRAAQEELIKGFFKLPVGLLALLFPCKIARVEDNRGADLRCLGKTVGHDLDTGLADGLEEAGDVHAVIRGMEDKIRGVTLEKFRAVHEMGALVHDLDETGEAAIACPAPPESGSSRRQ